MHPRDEMERMAKDLDQVEAELCRLQSCVWSVRDRLQKIMGKKVGFQYDDPEPRGTRVIGG